jgi:hypothetical protein
VPEIKLNITQIVLSASRRTDIPAFYLSWFMKGIDWGYFDVTNPYNQKVRRIPADPDAVHTIVFWSKDFSRFLAENTGETLQRRGYHLFFNYTVNSGLPSLEPSVPPLDNRLDQLDELSRRFGPRSVNWRFDPVCFYRSNGEPLKTNLCDFLRIAERACAAGIQRCITSFMDHYVKISRRLARIPGLIFLDPSPDRKVETLLWMNAKLRPMGIALHTCCERKIAERLTDGSGIRESACIPNSLLVELYGGQLSFKRDPGQRRRMGCGCQVSVDIGSYREHPCGHQCLYCYANPIRSGAVMPENSVTC